MRILIGGIVAVAGFFSSVLGAQELPEDYVLKARAEFEKSFEQAYGRLPEKEVTDRELQKFRSQVSGLTARIGKMAGEKAKNEDALAAALKQHRGIEVLKLIKKLNLSDLDKSNVSKSDIQQFVMPDTFVHQFDGKKLVTDDHRAAMLAASNIESKTEILFPEGEFVLDPHRLSRAFEFNQKPFPGTIAFVGKGKSKTTLRMGDIAFGRDVVSLSFRDITIDCGNDGMFDKRQGMMTLMFSNVRVIKFDAGHGGCDCLSVQDGLIVYAEDTEFLGGFGSSPGHGQVFDSHTQPFFGHFNRCSFLGIEYDLFRGVSYGGAKVWMDECIFDKQFNNVRNVEFLNCNFEGEKPKR